VRSAEPEPALIPLSTANRATVGKASVANASSATSSTASVSSPRTGRSSRANRNPGSGAVGSTPPSRGCSRAGGSAATAAISSGVGGAAPAAAPEVAAPGPPIPDRPITATAARTAPDPIPGSRTADGSGHSSGVAPTPTGGPPGRRTSGPVPNSSRNSAQRSVSSACVPTSTSRPASSTAIRSASASVERRCATSSVVRPEVSPRRVRWMAASVMVSTADIASSSTSTRGSVSTARASAIRCRWPPDRVSPRSPTRVS
jgi:hypothetical protein